MRILRLQERNQQLWSCARGNDLAPLVAPILGLRVRRLEKTAESIQASVVKRDET